MRKYLRCRRSKAWLNYLAVRKNNAYHFDSDDVIVLGVIFKMGVVHQLVVFKDSYPLLFIFKLFLGHSVHISMRGHKLFYRDRACVEILKNDVR